MLKERLIDSLKKDSTFTFDPINDLCGNTTLGIRVPIQIVTQVQTKSGGFRLDNIKSRREGIGKDGKLGKHTLMYKGLMKSPGMSVLSQQAMFTGLKLLVEVPVFIDDHKLWEWCCEEEGAQDRVSQNYFSLDAVLPNGQIIEIDGEQHYNGDEQDPGDAARDRYLLMRYWTKVWRFRSYQKNADVNFSMVRNDILTLPHNGFPFMANYDEIIWDSFYKRDIETRKALDMMLEGKTSSVYGKRREIMEEILGRIKEGT